MMFTQQCSVSLVFCLRRYAMARDFFNVAIDLNLHQLNAYYGLAVALEGLRDLPGALGAMRSYVHLSKADDAYLTKANAAIWEWDAELKTARGDKGQKNAIAGAKRVLKQ